MNVYVNEEELKAAYIGHPFIDTPWIYRSEEGGLISLSKDWTTWYTIADKNLGATTVYNSGATLSQANCGKFYQRGNCYWFPYTWATSTTTSRYSASGYWPGNYFTWDRYVKDYMWFTSMNTNLWWNTTNTLEARRGPCPEGFHVWTNTEYNTLSGLFWWWNFRTYGKFPICWRLTYGTGALDTGSYTFLRTSVPNGNNAITYSITHTYETTEACWFGWNIRPIKNEPVIPDSSRTKLY